jgi:deoxyribonuclease-4
MSGELLLGNNVNTTHGFITSAEYAHSQGANVFQIFFRSPHSLNAPRRKSSDLFGLNNNIKKYNMRALVHGSFILNFCRSKTHYIHTQAIKVLAEDLNDSIVINAIGVVVHMGKNVEELSNEEAISNYVSGIKSALKISDKRSVVVLETGAGQGTEVGTALIELGKIRNMFTNEEKKRIKFCLDTCHMYAAGYDIGNPEYIDKVLSDHIKLTLGWKNVVAIHLNDSKEPLNCHKDRHADIGKGYISEDGILRFVEVCHNHKVPIFLETPKDIHKGSRFTHMNQIQLIKDKLKKDDVI